MRRTLILSVTSWRLRIKARRRNNQAAKNQRARNAERDTSDRMALINTTLGEVEESELQRLDGRIDNDNETTQTVEYCLINCPGEAHKRGTPDADSHFCNLHVHRSVHVTLKQPLSLD